MSEGGCRELLLLGGVFPLDTVFKSVPELTVTEYRLDFPLLVSVDFQRRRVLWGRSGRKPRRIRLEGS